MTEETNKAAFNVEAIRRDFPIFEQTMRGKPLVFLDSAASAQKPQAVIDRMASFYRDEYASIHRGVYQLSEVATFEFEKARVNSRASSTRPTRARSSSPAMRPSQSTSSRRRGDASTSNVTMRS